MKHISSGVSLLSFYFLSEKNPFPANFGADIFLSPKEYLLTHVYR